MSTKMEEVHDNMLLQGQPDSEWLASKMQYSDVQKGKKGDTIYLTAADLTLTEDYLRDDTVNYVIQADTVHIAGELKVAGRDIAISARIISTDGDAVINTSGSEVGDEHNYGTDRPAQSGVNAEQKGKSGTNGEHGQAGGQGRNGGHITLAAERFQLGGSLQLIANGSNGGRGQDGGHGGDGREGVNGKDAQIGFFTNDPADNGGAGGHGGNGGNAGKSGNGGNGGHIYVGYVISVSEHFITMTSNAGRAGAEAEPGTGKPGGAGGLGGRIIKYARSMGSRNPSPIPYISDERKPSGASGNRGSDGQRAEKAFDGKSGCCGLDNSGKPTAIDYAQFYGEPYAASSSGAFPALSGASLERRVASSLEQKMLILHKSNIAYLAASEEKLEETATLLNWLLLTTPDEAWFQKLRSASSADAEFRNNLLTASVQWLSLRNTVSTLIAQLSQGLDYFGHPWNWVPLMPLDRYQTLGSNLIIAAQQAESLYKDYLQVKGSQDSHGNVMKQALAVNAERIKDMEKRKQELAGQSAQLKGIVDGMFADIKGKENHLEAKANEFVNALRLQLALDSLKATFDMVVTGVALVTNVTPAIAALKTGGAIASAVSNLIDSGKTIVIDEEGKDQDGIDKEKKKKEKELSKSIGNVKNTVSAGYALWKGGGNLIDLSHQISEAQDSFGYNSSMVAMSREQFEEMLKPVYNKVSKEKVASYRQAFYGYLNVVEDYQGKVQSYKALFLEDGKLTGEISRLRAEDERLHQALGERVDASLPLFHTYIFNLYTQTKLDLIDFLYQEYQAFRYLTLSHERFPKIQDSHVAELSKIHANITLKLRNALNTSENPVQPFKNIMIIFNEETFPEQFIALRENRAAFFPLSLDNKVIREKIAGKAHLMISNCQIHLSGAREDDGNVHVEYTHSGYSTFLDLHAERHDFVHNRSHGFYEYGVTLEGGPEAKEKTESLSGGVVGDGYNRIMPALLSVWSIKAPLTDLTGQPLNEGINLSNVKRIVLTLEGKAEAYAEKASPGKLKGIRMLEIPDNELYSAPNSVAEEEASIIIEL